MRKQNTIGAILGFFAIIYIFYVFVSFGTMLVYAALYHYIGIEERFEYTSVIVRYILAVWFLLFLNKKWLKMPLAFKKLQIQSDIIIISLAFLVAYGFNIQTIDIGLNTEDIQAFLFVIGPAIFEELWFRGIILRALVERFNQRRYGTLSAVFLSALLFASTHLLFSNFSSLQDLLLNTISAFALGVFLSSIYLRTNNLLIPMIFHFIANFSGTFLAASFFNTPTILATIVELIGFIAISLYLLEKNKKIKKTA